VAPGKLARPLVVFICRLGLRIRDRSIGVDDVGPLVVTEETASQIGPSLEFLSEIAGELLVTPGRRPPRYR